MTEGEVENSMLNAALGDVEVGVDWSENPDFIAIELGSIGACLGGIGEQIGGASVEKLIQALPSVVPHHEPVLYTPFAARVWTESEGKVCKSRKCEK